MTLTTLKRIRTCEKDDDAVVLSPMDRALERRLATPGRAFAAAGSVARGLRRLRVQLEPDADGRHSKEMLKILAIVGVFATGCATQTSTSTPPPPAVQTPTSGPAWLDCASDSECVLIVDPSCYLISINRDHVTEVTGRMAADLEKRGELGECPPWSIDYVPVCRAGKCSSTRSED